MKKMIILGLSILTLNVTAFSQEREITNATKEKLNIKLNIGGGISQFDLSNFNEIAKVNDFPSIVDGVQPALFLGLRVMNISNKISGDVNLGLIRGAFINGADYKASHSVYNVDVNVAYSFQRTFKNHIYASLGLGFLTHKIKYSEDLSDLNFGQSMQLIGGERIYTSRFNYYLNPRINYDYNLSKTKYFGVGVFVGYRVGLNNQNWTVGNNEVLTNAPTSNANGFYVGAKLTL